MAEDTPAVIDPVIALAASTAALTISENAAAATPAVTVVAPLQAVRNSSQQPRVSRERHRMAKLAKLIRINHRQAPTTPSLSRVSAVVTVASFPHTPLSTTHSRSSLSHWVLHALIAAHSLARDSSFASTQQQAVPSAHCFGTQIKLPRPRPLGSFDPPATSTTSLNTHHHLIARCLFLPDHAAARRCILMIQHNKRCSKDQSDHHPHHPSRPLCLFVFFALALPWQPLLCVYEQQDSMLTCCLLHRKQCTHFGSFGLDLLPLSYLDAH
ncbi:hypothetical protein BC831DRAFT_453026 [Entophlyctis helioformis]|nr:hypothetical protein BC831DRAFT_453026 [Entophlyctis helioformis]